MTTNQTTNITHTYEICPRCGAKTRPATSFSGSPSRFYMECTNSGCNTYIDTYVPMPHQEAVHRDNRLYLGNFGGYGSGKTFTTEKEVIKHALITPNALIVIGAKVTSQYENTLKRDLETDIPKQWVKDYSTIKSIMTLQNGSRIVWRPLEDPETLRSYNVTMFVILEASEVKYEAFTQFQTRIRNLAATVPALNENGDKVWEKVFNKRLNDYQDKQVFEADWRKGIIESNPDAGWVRSKFVLNANITYHGNVIDKDLQDGKSVDEISPFFSAHITATDCNYYLPPNFFEQNARGKPRWWVNKFLYGSFAYSEGRVYPRANSQTCEPFEIPPFWPRIVAHDWGMRDDSVFLCGAIDRYHNRVYIYKEARSNDMNIEQLSQMYFETTAHIPSGGMFCTPLIDPKSGIKRDLNKKTLMEHYMEKGILFQPAAVNVEARIYRLNTYLEEKTLWIFNDLKALLEEFSEYKFPERSLDNRTKSQVAMNKPVDKDNHGVNCLSGDTLIDTTDGKLPIKELVGRTDIYIQAYDEEKHTLTNCLAHDIMMTGDNQEVFEVTTDDGRSFKATGYHPILTQRGWVQVKDLTEDDEIVTKSITTMVTKVGIKSIKSAGTADVYNLEVPKYHNFTIEDGLVVHNCVEWITMALPSNPRDIVNTGAYDVRGNQLAYKTEKVNETPYTTKTDWHFTDSSDTMGEYESNYEMEL